MLSPNKNLPVSEVKLLYIGSVLPDKPEFHTKAFSRAGSMFQENLLTGLKNAGLVPSEIISIRQIQSFPRVRIFYVGKEYTELKNKMQVTLLPFLNMTPVKQMAIGVFTLLHILLWGWRTRHARHRVVYTYNLTVPPGLFTLLGARLIGAKAFVSLNDINVPGQTVPNTFLNRLDFWLHKKLIPRFDGHVVVADSIMKDFAPQASFVRVEGGITSDMLSKTGMDAGEKELNGAKFTIVSIGSLNETNGFKVLLQAFALLKGADYCLKIAGAGPLEDEIRCAARNDQRIKFYGMINFDEVLALYKSADVLINMRLTKELDTDYFFPSKLMEYLVSGTPVITTCPGHVADEFAGLAYLLTDESALGLANMINDVASLAPQTRVEMGKRARDYMQKYKTWDVQGRTVVNYIHNILMLS
jgi:glycosyltransferase involved in cell wall biosynthesis